MVEHGVAAKITDTDMDIDTVIDTETDTYTDTGDITVVTYK